MSKDDVYGDVGGVTDIREINREIRRQVKNAKKRSRLTELHRRSSYLCTLTNSPAWKKKFYGKLTKMKRVAREEFKRTAKAVNRQAKKIGTEPNYDTVWG